MSARFSATNQLAGDPREVPLPASCCGIARYPGGEMDSIYYAFEARMFEIKK